MENKIAGIACRAAASSNIGFNRMPGKDARAPVNPGVMFRMEEKDYDKRCN